MLQSQQRSGSWSAVPSSSWRPRAGLESALQARPEPAGRRDRSRPLHARESEFAQWQAQQTQHDAIQQQIAALRPLLETLPTSDDRG